MAYLAGSNPKKKPKHICNKMCKKNGCKENRGNNAGGEPQYLADTQQGLGKL